MRSTIDSANEVDRLGLVYRVTRLLTFSSLFRGNVSECASDICKSIQAIAFLHLHHHVAASAGIELGRDPARTKGLIDRWTVTRAQPSEERFAALLAQYRGGKPSRQLKLDLSSCSPAYELGLIEGACGVIDPFRDRNRLLRGIEKHLVRSYPRENSAWAKGEAGRWAAQQFAVADVEERFWFEQCGGAGRVSYVQDGVIQINSTDVRDALYGKGLGRPEPVPESATQLLHEVEGLLASSAVQDDTSDLDVLEQVRSANEAGEISLELSSTEDDRDVAAAVYNMLRDAKGMKLGKGKLEQLARLARVSPGALRMRASRLRAR